MGKMTKNDIQKRQAAIWNEMDEIEVRSRKEDGSIQMTDADAAKYDALVRESAGLSSKAKALASDAELANMRSAEEKGAKLREMLKNCVQKRENATTVLANAVTTGTDQNENGNLDAARGTNPNIRLFTVKRNAKIAEVDDVIGKWEEATPRSIRDFSATAYYFGRMVEEVIDVPVGLICVAWGGSACEAWMTPEMLEAFPQVKLPATQAEVDKTKQDITNYDRPENRYFDVTVKANVEFDVDIPDDAFKQVEAIIGSMTPYEREHPECLNARRRERIAKGSGTTMADVNRLLKQFEETRKMMKMVAGGNMKMPRMPRGFRR